VRRPGLDMVAPRAALIASIGVLVAVLLCACGSTSRPRARAGAAAVGARGPAFGLTEDNAELLLSPDGGAGQGGAAFALARRRLAALHPAYVRLLIDWAALQPRPDQLPALEGPVDGCARDVGPCASFAGVRAELAAVASERGPTSKPAVVVDIFGAPAWAASAPSGCETADAAPFARPLRPQAVASYRALIRSLLALAAREHVAISWWSPWNEPNDPRFVSPQRASCSASAPARSPGVYAELVRAMVAELRSQGGEPHLVLGELNDLSVDSPRTTSVASFIAALPADVLCLAGAWSIHAYAARHDGAPADAVGELEAALDARGGCARGAPIWVTEAGAGAAHPGAARAAGAADQQAGCRVLAGQLLGWYADPRVTAVFQYSFRDDPAFPVGLLSADLAHVYPAYGLWLRLTRAMAVGEPPVRLASACT
jgi:hypothetical protein